MRTSLQYQLTNLRVGFQLWYGSVTAHSGRVLPVIAMVLVVLVVAASAAQASPRAPRASAAGGVSYYGLTSKGAPLFIQTSRDGRVITRAVGALTMQCTGGNAGPYAMDWIDRWSNVVVSLGRTFTESVSDTSTPPGGQPIDVSDSFTGRFDKKRKSLTGSWDLHFVYHQADGSTDDCDTGAVKFTAKRMQA